MTRRPLTPDPIVAAVLSIATHYATPLVGRQVAIERARNLAMLFVGSTPGVPLSDEDWEGVVGCYLLLASDTGRGVSLPSEVAESLGVCVAFAIDRMLRGEC